MSKPHIDHDNGPYAWNNGMYRYLSIYVSFTHIFSNSIRTLNSIRPRIVFARFPVLNEIVSVLD